MMLEKKWFLKRLSLLVALLAANGAMTVSVLFLWGGTQGYWLLMALCGAVFCLFLWLQLEWERQEQGIFDELANNLLRIGVTYFLSAAGTVAISFLPPYLRPVLLVSVAMAMVSSPFVGLMAGAYTSLLLTVAGDGSIWLLACYLLSCVFGSMLVPCMRKAGSLLWGGFMAWTGSFCFTTLFLRMEAGRFSVEDVIGGALAGTISAVAMVLLFHFWNGKIIHSRENLYSRILKEDYGLAQTMKEFSNADYAHARKASRIAGGCAAALGVDEHLAAAGGFYYRVGRLEGEPYVENGVDLARKHKFPPELVQILAEYNGEKYLPSTVESALVHIVDNVVAKFDVLDKTTLSSSWNQDIVVYQTLNENSAKGLYDKSGLSMNMYLVVRDYLIKEAELYDSDHGK